VPGAKMVRGEGEKNSREQLPWLCVQPANICLTIYFPQLKLAHSHNMAFYQLQLLQTTKTTIYFCLRLIFSFITEFSCRFLG